jgi:hypothetical protein
VRSGPPTIHELAHRVAAHRALHLLVFAVAGEWARSTPGPDRRWLARTAHEHAWLADRWAERFPVVPGLDLDEATATATAAMDERRTRLLDTPPDARREAVAALLRTFADVLRAERDAVDPDLDAPTARVLDLAIADTERQLAD